MSDAQPAHAVMESCNALFRLILLLGIARTRGPSARAPDLVECLLRCGATSTRGITVRVTPRNGPEYLQPNNPTATGCSSCAAAIPPGWVAELGRGP